MDHWAAGHPARGSETVTSLEELRQLVDMNTDTFVRALLELQVRVTRLEGRTVRGRLRRLRVWLVRAAWRVWYRFHPEPDMDE